VVDETKRQDLTKAPAKVGLALGDAGLIIANQRRYQQVSQIDRVLIKLLSTTN
jgi:hypothetical protein